MTPAAYLDLFHSLTENEEARVRAAMNAVETSQGYPHDWTVTRRCIAIQEALDAINAERGNAAIFEFPPLAFQVSEESVVLAAHHLGLYVPTPLAIKILSKLDLPRIEFATGHLDERERETAILTEIGVQIDELGYRHEAAARSAGWMSGGGYIYDSDAFDSWKEAVSWCGEDGRDERERDSKVYGSWKDCCLSEGLLQPDRDPLLDGVRPQGRPPRQTRSESDPLQDVHRPPEGDLLRLKRSMNDRSFDARALSLTVEDYLTEKLQQYLIDLAAESPKLAVFQAIGNTLVAIERSEAQCLPSQDEVSFLPMDHSDFIQPERIDELEQICDGQPASAIRQVVRDVVLALKSGCPAPPGPIEPRSPAP